MWDLARQTFSRLTFDAGSDFVPAWRADGRRLIFSSFRVRPAALFSQAADGTGAAEALGSAGLVSGLTPDGGRVIFTAGEGNSFDVKMLALEGARRVEPLVQTPFNERNGEVCPNGRWLAYESDSSGRLEIYVRPFPSVGERQWQISTAGGTRRLWAPSGQELFYLGPEAP